MRRKYSNDDLIEAVADNLSIAGVLRQLGLRPIGGNYRTINRIDNLILLCPNCHALTNNYRGKATLSALSEKREVERRKFKEALTGNADGNLEPSLLEEEGAETRHGAPKDKKSMVKE